MSNLIEPQTVEFNQEMYVELQHAYKRAVSMGETEFNFRGGVYLTDYAKYLLQYLDQLFGGEQ